MKAGYSFSHVWSGDVSVGLSSVAVDCVISGPDRAKGIVTTLKSALKQMERRVPADLCRRSTPLRQNGSVSLTNMNTLECTLLIFRNIWNNNYTSFNIPQQI